MAGWEYSLQIMSSSCDHSPDYDLIVVIVLLLHCCNSCISIMSLLAF